MAWQVLLLLHCPVSSIPTHTGHIYVIVQYNNLPRREYLPAARAQGPGPRLKLTDYSNLTYLPPGSTLG
ncbi:hypothetical protein KC19_3G007900 [Ceratodon purpureus]|uniref:Secreted protein n=1 Tax=Ceratodon purpureus TaxID=3225 RepID=A0A8T0IEG7_CERPU|nr:hypothetical protein KC19_3G007900 [Ceratodon purpureus]